MGNGWKCGQFRGGEAGQVRYKVQISTDLIHLFTGGPYPVDIIQHILNSVEFMILSAYFLHD